MIVIEEVGEANTKVVPGWRGKTIAEILKIILLKAIIIGRYHITVE